MTRSLIGLLLLIALLAGGLFVQEKMEDTFVPLSRELDSAARYAGDGDWESAESLSEQAAGGWERSRYFAAMLADHGPMEDIDSLFARLTVYAREQDTAEFSAAARELARRIRAMSDAHQATVENVM